MILQATEITFPCSKYVKMLVILEYASAIRVEKNPLME